MAPGRAEQSHGLFALLGAVAMSEEPIQHSEHHDQDQRERPSCRYHHHQSTSPRISNLKHQNIRRPHLRQPIHLHRNLPFRHHRTNSNPRRILQRRHSRRSLPRRDLGRFFEQGARDVVLAEDKFLGGDDAFYARGDEID